MSTRSMTIVKQTYSGDEKWIPLYRHCDGYPAGAGGSLVTALEGAIDTESLVARLLAMRYIHSGQDGGPIYRAATWMPEDQGDLEYVYQVESVKTAPAPNAVRPSTSEWQVTVYARNGWSDGTDDWRNWNKGTYSVGEFERMVLTEQLDIYKRMDARKRQA